MSETKSTKPRPQGVREAAGSWLTPHLSTSTHSRVSPRLADFHVKDLLMMLLFRIQMLWDSLIGTFSITSCKGCLYGPIRAG